MTNKDEVLELLGRVDERTRLLAERQDEMCGKMDNVQGVVGDLHVRVLALEDDSKGRSERWRRAGHFILEVAILVAGGWLLYRLGVKP